MVEMMLDSTRSYLDPLTADRLFGWHSAPFPAGRSGLRAIRTGAWRDDRSGPMQVVSGPIGRGRVRFEAPGAALVAGEMARFLDWFDGPTPIDPVLKAALAHFWFVTIHPFDDGNGRIARAVADLALARTDGSPLRFYSMSARIQAERGDYYETLERSQKAGLDVTPWIRWFLGCLDRAIEASGATLAAVFAGARFWNDHAGEAFNDRQHKVLGWLLGAFEGKLTSSKWAKLARCSQDSAGRDIADLVRRGILREDPTGGRSTSYSLVGPVPITGAGAGGC